MFSNKLSRNLFKIYVAPCTRRSNAFNKEWYISVMLLKVENDKDENIENDQGEKVEMRTSKTTKKRMAKMKTMPKIMKKRKPKIKKRMSKIKKR